MGFLFDFLQLFVVLLAGGGGVEVYLGSRSFLLGDVFASVMSSRVAFGSLLCGGAVRVVVFGFFVLSLIENDSFDVLLPRMMLSGLSTGSFVLFLVEDNFSVR